MAKRKLSAEKRSELREELRKAITNGKKTADVLREVSAKYGITTITARWYLKSIDDAPKRGAGRRGPGRPPGRPSKNSDPSALLKSLQSQMAAAKAASRLAPKLQKLSGKQALLKRTLARTERRLEATTKKADKLRGQIEALVGR
jgi:hypothetical protein